MEKGLDVCLVECGRISFEGLRYLVGNYRLPETGRTIGAWLKVRHRLCWSEDEISFEGSRQLVGNFAGHPAKYIS